MRGKVKTSLNVLKRVLKGMSSERQTLRRGSLRLLTRYQPTRQTASLYHTHLAAIRYSLVVNVLSLIYKTQRGKKALCVSAPLRLFLLVSGLSGFG